jgi:ribosomal protein S18 acetylase RimI-like enzyme
MISIRPAKFEEIDIIADFQIRLAHETENIALDQDILSSGVKTLLKDPAKGIYYVAELDGKVIGCFLITYEWSDWRNGTIWWLQSVYVMPPYRRQGVFKEMYDHIIGSISGDPAITGLRLYVDKSNSRAQSVYQSMGMNGDHYTVFEWMKK